jgi:O-antigen ligase
MMSFQSTKIPAIGSYISNNKYFFKMFWFLVVQLAVVTVAILIDQIIFVPAVILGLLFLYWSVRNPSLWIFSIFIFHIIILIPSEGISIWEVLYALYAFGITVLWAFNKWYRHEIILQSFGDRTCFLFFIICCISYVPAIIWKADAFKWLRELVMFLPYFLYLPFREALIKERKRTLLALGTGFLILSIYIAFTNYLNYKNAANTALYSWQLLAGRQHADEPLFMTGILFGSVFYLYARTARIKLMTLVLISFYVTALILTFSRGYWFGAALGIVVLLMVLQRKPRIELLYTIVGVILAVTLIILFAFGNYGSSVLDTIIQRAGGQGLSVIQDPSLRARYLETQSVIQYIARNPIVGYGLGASFFYHNPLSQTYHETVYIHNVYLFLWFKLGIIGLVLFLLTYMYHLWEAIKMIRKYQSSLEYFLLCAIISLFIVMLVISITSPQFISRDSILVIAVCWALIGAFRHGGVKDTIETTK